MISENELEKARESGYYPAYTQNFEPLYYVTAFGYTLCAACAEENARFGRAITSIMYIQHMRVNESELLYCNQCQIRIEQNIELKKARDMALMIDKKVQGNW